MTAAIGRRLGEAAGSGDIFVLQGDLGAGKTQFIKGLAEGLGLDGRLVSSPTFTIMQRYSGGRLPLQHFDLYRLESVAELEGLGFAELVDDWPGVTATEWGDRFREAMPPWAIWVNIEHVRRPGQEDAGSIRVFSICRPVEGQAQEERDDDDDK